MSAPNPPDPLSRLERRLEKAARLWLLGGDPDGLFLDEFDVRERIDDRLHQPEVDDGNEVDPQTTQPPPAPIVILAAIDMGRVKLTPIRTLALRVTLRANAGVADGQRERLDEICAELEARFEALLPTHLHDDEALPLHIAELTSSEIEIHTFHAARIPGCQLSSTGQFREQSYALEVKAVKAELTEPAPA